MKKIILGTFGLICINSFSFAQNGLEGVIVEKYYFANPSDAAQADVESTNAGAPYTTGALPVSSVTYRIYADMLPGYKLLSVYADVTQGHQLKFTTTTNFYNNPLGSTTPSSTKTAIKNNLLALDSWFSLGGVATGQYGILKSEDDGVANNVTTGSNPNGVLLTTDAVTIGLPLTTQDGMIAGTGIQTPSFAGFTNEQDVFGDGSVVGNSMVLTDGSVYTPNGAVGPDPATNKVLIAQITTGGKLCFELNILLKAPSNAGEFYVANNPASGEITIPELSQCFDPVSVGINKSNSTTNPSTADLFNIYPNPAKDMLKLVMTTSKQSTNNSYGIYSVVGTQVMYKTFSVSSANHVENIDISSLESGVYFIKISVDGVLSTKKVIKN